MGTYESSQLNLAIRLRYLETTSGVKYCVEPMFEVEKCHMLHPAEKINENGCLQLGKKSLFIINISETNAGELLRFLFVNQHHEGV